MADPKIPASIDLDVYNKFLNLQKEILSSVKDRIKDEQALNALASVGNNLAKKAVESVKGRNSVEYKTLEIQQKMATVQREITKMFDSGFVSFRAYRNKQKELLQLMQQQANLEREAATQAMTLNKFGLSKTVEYVKQINELWSDNKMLVIAMAGLAIWKKIFSVFTDMDNAAAKFRMEMGASRQFTKVIDENARSIAFEFAQMGVNAAMVYDSIVAMGRELGSTAFVTKDMAENVSVMQAQFNVAQKTSAEFLKSMGLASQQTANARTHMLLFAQGLSDAAGTPLSEVMNDINAATKSSYSYITRSSIGLVKAAVEAKRMGTSLANTAESAKTLMEFTKSVDAEMKASVLLGESINLQRARELSYRRDLAGLNKEILKIMKETNFENLDPFQQEAVAAALGKSASELSSMAQAERQRLDLERDMSKETQTQLTAYKKMTQTNESNAKALANSAKEQLKIKSNQAAIASITASWNAILQRVGEVFLPTIAKVLGVVASTLSGINKFIEANPWTKWVLAIAAVAAGIVGIGVAVMAVGRAFGLLGKLGGGGAGGGIGGTFKGLANGVKAMGNKQVLMGIVAIGLLGVAMIPFAAAMMMVAKVPAKVILSMSVAMIALGTAGAILGAFAPLTIAGAVAIVILGVAMMGFAAAAWIASKAIQNLAGVPLVKIAGGLLTLGLVAPFILAFGAAALLAAPGIGLFSLALIPLSIMAKRAGDSMMSMGTGFKLMVDSIERLQNVSLIGTVIQVHNLAKAVTELSQALKTMPDIQVEKIERLQMKGAAAGETPVAGVKDTSVVDEIRGMRDELKKLREDFANGTLKATVNLDAQKVDAASGRSLEFKGVSH